MTIHVSIKGILTGHADAIYALERGINGLLYTGSADMFIGGWDLETFLFDKPVAKTDSPVYALAVIPENGQLVIGSRDGNLYLVDAVNRLPLKNIIQHTKEVFDIKIHGDKIFTVAGDGCLAIWRKEDFFNIKNIILSKENLRCIAISPSGKILAIGSSDHTINILDTATFTKKAVLTGHENSVFTCQFLDDKTLVSGSRDAHLFIWKYENENWHLTKKIPAHNYTINHICLHPTKPIFATASRDKTVKIWNSNTYELLKVIDRSKFEDAHKHSVNRLLWWNEHTLLSAGDDKRVIAWNVDID